MLPLFERHLHLHKLKKERFGASLNVVNRNALIMLDSSNVCPHFINLFFPSSYSYPLCHLMRIRMTALLFTLCPNDFTKYISISLQETQ